MWIRRAAVLVVLFVAGCNTFPEVPYERAAAIPIKTIGVVTPAFPDDGDVILASTVGQSFGLIGGLIDAAMKANRDSQFNAILQQRKFVMRDYFADAVARALVKQGYVVVVIPVTRANRNFLTDYPTPTLNGADAFLDVANAQYGYVAAGIGNDTPYRPWIRFQARLVSARDRSVLMQDAINYNPLGTPLHVVTIPPDPQRLFPDFDTLAAAPDEAVKGLALATEASAQTVAELLR